jgi:hypothetical protein
MLAQSLSRSSKARDFVLPDAGHPLVMGIVNVTPDSFSDGGKFFDPAKAIAHARRLADEARISSISARSPPGPMATQNRYPSMRNLRGSRPFYPKQSSSACPFRSIR